jgi:hypothetical protein
MSGELCISNEPSAAWYWPGLIDKLPEAYYHYDSHVDWVENSDNLPILGGANGMQPLDRGTKLLPCIEMLSLCIEGPFLAEDCLPLQSIERLLWRN